MITDDWRFGWRVDAACRDTDLAVFPAAVAYVYAPLAAAAIVWQYSIVVVAAAMVIEGRWHR